MTETNTRNDEKLWWISLGISETLKKWWWWFSAYLAIVLCRSELWPPRVGSGPRLATHDWAEGIYVKMGLCRESDVVVVGVKGKSELEPLVRVRKGEPNLTLL
nr:hypothetical protein CFP56_69600 [Quercus suber]